ncbi:MAG: efflux RND transporter permease subunit [Candidatus Marinimicrobia bacterium]|nr:efflux RND transporter permease subunit [Candidatus Neomarinimicrobiota bacterium]MCF7828231.1 efflux RND transporter permease subunit [Candidatus Neomarinimicrobiota bacterium]MCF7879594.1 efflux RND transporter permease subunit [Candidatus Neomarinimicrobiota bacterium]
MAEQNDRKEFWLSSFSVKNRISVLVMIALIAIMGIRSYLAIPKEAQPDITIPNVLVITLYPGVSPEDMESLITRKLEDELSNISDIKEMTSTSSEGYSNIMMEFNTDVNMDEALQKVREKVDLARPELPDDVEEPMIQEINLSEFPIMQVNVSGDYGLENLKTVAEDLQDKFETIPSVLEVNLSGGLEKEVQVNVDLPKLKYYGLAFSDIIYAIQGENVTIPGGNIDVGTKKFLLRIPGEYETPKPIEDIVVSAPGDRPIYIRDVAEVKFANKDRETYASLDGSPVISLSITKRSGQNIIETAEAVKEIINEELPGLPPSTDIKITSDQSKNIDSIVTSLENNIISGLLLVIGILLFFLGLRNASFVGVAIPLSMFTAFIIIDSIDMTMNMVVLFSLILALGMLVDNSIVVVENIYRYLEEGFDNFAAAKKGTGEVAAPIISGTATTLAAFFPLTFWPGIVGEFMSYLPITLIITLGSSLFVALVINPVLCALFMDVDHKNNDSKPRMTKKGKYTTGVIGALLLGGFLLSDFLTWIMLLVAAFLLWIGHKFILKPLGDWWQTRGLNRVLNIYERQLRWALDNPGKIFGVSIGVLFLSFVVFSMFNSGVEFFPEDIPPSDAYVQIEGPVGTNVEFTKRTVDKILAKVPTIPHPGDVESVLSTAGSAISAGFGNQGSSSHRGTVVLNFVDYQERKGSSIEAMEYMRSEFPKGIAGANITVERPQAGPPTGKPINLEISGQSMETLTEISNEVLNILENDPVYAKLEGLESDLPEGRPEVQIRVDREKAAVFGLSTSDIGSTVRQAVSGATASQYRDGKDEYDITVRLAEEYRNDLNTLSDLNVMAEEGRQIPLSSVADWTVGEGFGGINHIDGTRVITVSADVRSPYQANAVLGEVQQALQPYLSDVPSGYSTTYTGQQQEQQEAQDFLSGAFLIAVFLMAFILISQFNSVSKPIIVLTSVIMSISGVLYGLVIFQMPFGIIMTGVGIISLAGVVVNNAIVMIDYIDILRTRDNLSLYDALVEGGRVRFRPVILTAITTTLGLIPLAIGFNLDFIVLTSNPAEFFRHLGQYLYMGGEQAAWWSPMATAVITGLLFATFLTLIVVPVLYLLIERGKKGTTRFLFGTDSVGVLGPDDAE